MEDVVSLYQVGGFRAHTSGVPKDLAQLLYPSKGGIELILGVLPSGATYLLLEEGPFLHLFRRSRDRPWRSSDFTSLSPVSFETREALEKKLTQYVHNKKNKNGQPRDRSKANTAYTTEGIQTPSLIGLLRAEFELQRVFYRLRRSQLPSLSIYRFSPATISRLQLIKVASFAFTLWERDQRLYGERLENPTILDIGWTEYELPDSSKELRVKTSLHWRIDENTSLSNPKSKLLDFKYGTTEILGKNEVASRLQARFAALSPNLMLLVFNEEESRPVLHSLGVDIKSWQSGLSNSFNAPRSSHALETPRRRSRSPARNGSRDPRQRPRSPDRPPATAGAIKVDIRELFHQLKQVPATAVSIDKTARDLQLNVGPEKGWCAGNESVLLGYIWEAMASSNAIDDQREARWSSSTRPISPVAVPEEDSKPSASTKVEAPAPDPLVNNDSDSDFDPNDVAPMGNQGGLLMDGVEPPSAPVEGGAPVLRDPYDELEDDDW